MHKFTLTFLNKDVKQQYQSMNKKQSIEFQNQQKWIFKSFLQIYASNKRHKLYDFFLIFVVVSYSLYFPLSKYFSLTSGDNQYVDGYLISVGTFGMINIFSFRFKTTILAQKISSE
ncbi:unnamed protein product [Paramecium primaurelia]|uniref:Uncharacterized protein n=1 Tax=Paramecium primaurelia TaxID=5886 RepID=A0A8S1N0Y0_PARPR|nr:unnamed protein product [Paramecium primaurelia]